MSVDIDMAEIAQLFIEESLEGLAIMESGLLNLDLGAADPETMDTIFRAAHSIKGGGATFGFTEISDFAHHLETLLDEMRQGTRAVTREAVDLMLLSVDCIQDMINGLGDGPIDTTRSAELEVELEIMLSSEVPVESAAATPASSTGTQDATPCVWSIDFKPKPGILKSCNDPLRMFRELQELGELEVQSQGAEAIEFDRLDPEECQLSWQLRLHAAVSREQIEEVFAWVQDECELLIEPLEGDAVVSEGDTAPLDKGQSQPQNSAVKPAAKAKTTAPETGSIRVNIDKVDALINLVGELVITQSMLSRYRGDFDVTQLEGLREGLAQLSRSTRDIQESVMAIRMLPMSFAFNRFPRLVRDTGNALNKKVELKLTGEHTELDKTVLEKIGDPLVHLVRNSLDHGLETPEVRLAAGKPETGVLELSAYHEGGNIVIEVIDDGVVSRARQEREGEAMAKMQAERKAKEEAAQAEGKSTRRQFVNFAFFKLDPAFRRLPQQEIDVAKEEFISLLEDYDSTDETIVLGYTTMGIRADAEIMLWRISYELENFQKMQTAMFRTKLGKYLGQTFSYFSQTKRSMYMDIFNPEHEEDRTHIIPGKAKYLFIYPFTKKREWYLLTKYARQ
ncbi:MAG: chlorite dismutase family protein, partial [Proteobacteria bacterium]|nr:chlorite dismutase family protein [Pseudomonadota bacterium]